MYTWTPEELEKVKNCWFDNIPSKVYEVFNHIPKDAIKYQATKHKFPRSEKLKAYLSNMLGERNKADSKNKWTKEKALSSVLEYKSKNELLLLNPSLYNYIYRESLQKEAYKHMLESRFPYSENFIQSALEYLFPAYEIRLRDRTAIAPKELDIYIPELNVAIEYDGIRFHTSDEHKEKDKLKDYICKEKGITLYRIKEVNTGYPNRELNILKQLTEIGYKIPIELLDTLVLKTFNKQMSIANIKEKVASCGSLIEFKNKYPKEYDRITALGLQQQIFHSIKRNLRKKFLSDDTVAEEFKVFTSSKDIRKNLPKLFDLVLRDKQRYPKSWEVYQSKYTNSGYSSTKSSDNLVLT